MSLLNHDFDEKRISTLQKAAKQEIERMDSIIFEKRRELKEYDALMKRLTDLPKKLQHHAMVPFGSAGFMPGKIVRTNEVMMLVGDGYFVEKSCHEANEALLRRTKAIEKIIDDCEADKKLVKQQMDFAERLFSHKHNSDEVEIREEFDEEKEAEFKRKRLENSCKKTMEGQTCEMNVNITKRLDELEIQERENGELCEDGMEEENTNKPPPGVSSKDYQKLLESLNNLSSDDYESEEDLEDTQDINPDDLDSDDLTEQEIDATTTHIEVSKSSRASQMEKDSKEEPERKRSVRFAQELEHLTTIDNQEPVSKVTSTTTTFSPSGPILRNRDYQSPVDVSAVARMNEPEPQIMPGSTDAFNGIIRERIDVSFSPDSDVNLTTPTEPTKRVSKFKLQRLKQC